jgi:2-hydroxy-6-oxonona-2,4-dienedioate hydrolase
MRCWHSIARGLTNDGQPPLLLIHERYDQMVPFEVSIATLNHTPDSCLVLLNSCGHWPPFEKPAE